MSECGPAKGGCHMSGPRDPDKDAEQALEEHRRRFPTERDYDHAVQQGRDVEPDQEDRQEDYRD